MGDILNHMNQLIIQPQNPIQAPKTINVPPLIANAGKKAVLRFIDFFTAEIENDNIEKISGLRDRALIGIMVFSFARVSAVINMCWYRLLAMRSEVRLIRLS